MAIICFGIPERAFRETSHNVYLRFVLQFSPGLSSVELFLCANYRANVLSLSPRRKIYHDTLHEVLSCLFTFNFRFAPFFHFPPHFQSKWTENATGKAFLFVSFFV